MYKSIVFKVMGIGVLLYGILFTNTMGFVAGVLGLIFLMGWVAYKKYYKKPTHEIMPEIFYWMPGDELRLCYTKEISAYYISSDGTGMVYYTYDKRSQKHLSKNSAWYIKFFVVNETLKKRQITTKINQSLGYMEMIYEVQQQNGLIEHKEEQPRSAITVNKRHFNNGGRV